mmetsp:Transcript_63153/g.174615  ORF Transcript_63153/g.174615 Transcript_63153/m.174615 type:complete len:207 (-) Transcript_63153:364-984(-)
MRSAPCRRRRKRPFGCGGRPPLASVGRPRGHKGCRRTARRRRSRQRSPPGQRTGACRRRCRPWARGRPRCICPAHGGRGRRGLRPRPTGGPRRAGASPRHRALGSASRAPRRGRAPRRPGHPRPPGPPRRGRRAPARPRRGGGGRRASPGGLARLRAPPSGGGARGATNPRRRQSHVAPRRDPAAGCRRPRCASQAARRYADRPSP